VSEMVSIQLVFSTADIERHVFYGPSHQEQGAEAADMTLDAQIDEHLQEQYEQKTLDHETPDSWFHNRDEVVAFARWYWQGTYNAIGTTGEILDYFEKPWLFNEEYAGYKHETH